MKAFTLALLPTAAIGLFAASAMAQTTTDDARAMAAQRTAAQQREAAAHAPIAQPVDQGDYRAEAHERQRLMQWQAGQRAFDLYEAGVRSQPVVVRSTDTARAEAQRLRTEQALAEQASGMRSTVSAR